MSRILVSGANGFIAGHTIARLLRDGHRVVGTTRDPSDRARNGHLLDLEGSERLTLVAADLLDPDPFSDHVDVDMVLHMASPYTLVVDDPQRDLVDPAVRGTLAMLRAAAGSPSVRRVVLTSSVAAITDEPDGRVFTEGDWNTKSSLRRNPYYFAKTEAERAAWAFMEDEAPAFDLVAINPFIVVGPSLGPTLNTSNEILLRIAEGIFPAILDLNWAFVDVRDVADAHVEALRTPAASGRYLVAAETWTLGEVVDLMRGEGWDYPRLPTLRLDGPVGTVLGRLFSLTRPSGQGTYLRTHLGGRIRFDNGKVMRELDIVFRDVRETLLTTLADLVRWGHLAPPPGGVPGGGGDTPDEHGHVVA